MLPQRKGTEQPCPLSLGAYCPCLPGLPGSLGSKDRDFSMEVLSTDVTDLAFLLLSLMWGQSWEQAVPQGQVTSAVSLALYLAGPCVAPPAPPAPPWLSSLGKCWGPRAVPG